MDFARSSRVALARTALPKQTRLLVPSQGQAGRRWSRPCSQQLCPPLLSPCSVRESSHTQLCTNRLSSAACDKSEGHSLSSSLYLGFPSLLATQPMGPAPPSHCRTWRPSSSWPASAYHTWQVPVCIVPTIQAMGTHSWM